MLIIGVLSGSIFMDNRGYARRHFGGFRVSPNISSNGYASRARGHSIGNGLQKT